MFPVRPGLIAVFAVLCTLIALAPGEASACPGESHGKAAQTHILQSESAALTSIQAPSYDMRQCRGPVCCGNACYSGTFAMMDSVDLPEPERIASALPPAASRTAQGLRQGGIRRPPRA